MVAIKELVLYSYCKSSASWRVRAALAIKKIPFKYQSVNLLERIQHDSSYTDKVNPMHQVPALKVTMDNGKEVILTQSLAIIEFLEENYQNDKLLPSDPILRAKCRAIAETIASGVQPFQNLETLLQYGEPLGVTNLDADKRKQVASFWLSKKMKNLEKLVKQTAGKCCVGDTITLADVCLVPQMFAARRFELDTNEFPLLQKIDEDLQKLDIFKISHPSACPDAN